MHTLLGVLGALGGSSRRRLRREVGRVLARVEGWRHRDEPPVLALEAVRRRLELWIAASLEREIAIEPLVEPERRGTLSRLVREPALRRARSQVAQSDAHMMRLPATLDASDGEDAALARFRLLALEHATRIVRGTAAHAPGDDRPLERDLYLLRESASVDAAICGTTRAIAATLRAERAAALVARASTRHRKPYERAVESLVRRVLAAPADAPPAEVPTSGRPEESLAWAREQAARIRAADPGWVYRGVLPVDVWGIVHPTPPDVADPSAHRTTTREGGDAGESSEVAPKQRDSLLDGAQPPDVAQQWDAAMRETIDNPLATMNLGPAGAATDVESDAGENLIRADDASALHEDDAVSAPVDIGDPSDRVIRLRTLATLQYPEWDSRAMRLVPRAVTARVVHPPDAEPEWASRTLREHAPLVRQVRHRFERLRARRTRLNAQRDGEELDVGACVRAFVDRAAGSEAGEDRLYVAVRPARRPIAILLLVDVSGSTDLPISGSQRIIDVERTAVLLAGEALEAMGDAYAVVAFSGRGAHDVRLATIKDFAERHGGAVRRRVSALEPRGNTRLGAAVRHATAMLSRQPAGHRLLLLLSDGQPNDADRYQGEYGIEDSRQAVHEARARGVFPFCLTVDREGPDYLPRIFGAAGHTILRDPAQLPTALLDVVKALVVE